MPVRSAGILLYRSGPAGLEVWIGHMGGPFWAHKDAHAWSIPKGEYSPDEDPLAAALREFEEEMGSPAPAADYQLLGDFRQSSGKIVTAFAAEHDFAPDEVRSNTFELEWPKGSGTVAQFPEIDNAGWFPVEAARLKLVKGQEPILHALLEHVRTRGSR
ncbi:NUDIX domain protein [Arthrobacter ulcerisalmonis]|uniref:NUDIX domain protein n=1 Tax=Arthrobacter ulcerisalmonis TaxID=2483813 RepID=A0A3P5WG11_9MICC|nr:NUDIX domain-containing protein [Arthrobacter ulcerisalmonis]VDC18406.1 NUDIX domain protein [Arthrobacter ulcerisalmonis]